MRNRVTLALCIAGLLLLAMVFAVAVNPGTQPVMGAPAAAITPVAIEDPIRGDTTLIKFYDAEALTADDQNCVDLREYRVIDLEWTVDQALGPGSDNNTTTLTLEHTNGAPSALTTNTTGQTIVSANQADADDLNRYDLFGAITCVDVNITTANPVTWTVYGLARK